MIKINLMSDRRPVVDRGPSLGQQLDEAARCLRDTLFYAALAYIAGTLLWKLFLS